MEADHHQNEQRAEDLLTGVYLMNEDFSFWGRGQKEIQVILCEIRQILRRLLLHVTDFFHICKSKIGVIFILVLY